MEARRFARHVMAVSPFALVLTMGIHTHVAKPHQFLTYTKQQEMRMDAYRSVFRAATEALALPPTKNAAAVRKLAAQWSTESEIGKLQLLFPAFQEECFDEGPRSQVMQAWMRIGAELERTCNFDRKGKRFNETAEDSALLVRFSEAFKQSDFITECAGIGYERRVFAKVDAWYGQCDKSHKQLFKEAILRASQDRGELSQLAKIAETDFEDFSNRHEAEDPTAEGLDTFLADGVTGVPGATTHFVQEDQTSDDLKREIHSAMRGDAQVRTLIENFLHRN